MILSGWVSRYMQHALVPNGEQTLSAALVKLAYEWQTSFGNGYPLEPIGDPVTISTALVSKWRRFFVTCNEIEPGRTS